MERELIANLVQRGVPAHVAQGMVANMIAESNLQPGINEAAPVVPGSRGGYGLNQWTGPRRRQFEAFAQEQGRPLDDPGVQLDFTLWELTNTEKRAGDAIMKAPDAVTAARLYSDLFLRPGVPHMERRLSEAERLAGMPIGTNTLAPRQTAPQSALQPRQQPMNGLALADTRIDPRAFYIAPNALAPLDLSQYRV